MKEKLRRGPRGKKGKGLNSRLPYRTQHTSHTKGKLKSHDNILVKAHFRKFTDYSTRKASWHGGKTLLYLRSSTHSPGKGSQIFWRVCPSEPLWPGSHCRCTPYKVLCRRLTWSSRQSAPTVAEEGSNHRDIHSFSYFFLTPFFLSRALVFLRLHSSQLPLFAPPLCLTILDVRLSRSSVLMMSLRCSLISPSLETLSAELQAQKSEN